MKMIYEIKSNRYTLSATKNDTTLCLEIDKVFALFIIGSSIALFSHKTESKIYYNI